MNLFFVRPIFWSGPSYRRNLKKSFVTADQKNGYFIAIKVIWNQSAFTDSLLIHDTAPSISTSIKIRIHFCLTHLIYFDWRYPNRNKSILIFFKHSFKTNHSFNLPIVICVNQILLCPYIILRIKIILRFIS